MSQQQGITIGFQVVGAVVGSFFGAPQIGLLVGSLAGQLVSHAIAPKDPDQITEVDTLADVAITKPGAGQMVPIIYGTYILPGLSTWVSDKIPIVTEDVQEIPGTGKGGGGQKQITRTTTYRIHTQLVLCEGPIEDVTRIWMDATLIYDAGQPGDWLRQAAQSDGDPDITGLGTDAFIISKGTEEGLLRFIVFRGTTTQEAWAGADAFVGAGNFTANRGIAHIIATVDLGQTGIFHNLRFEIVKERHHQLLHEGIIHTPGVDRIWTFGSSSIFAKSGFTQAGNVIRYTQDVVPQLAVPIEDTSVSGTTLTARVEVATIGRSVGDAEVIFLALNRSRIAALNVESGRLLPIGPLGTTYAEFVDIRTAQEQTDNTDLGIVAMAAKDHSGADSKKTTVAYVLPGLDQIGQVETKEQPATVSSRLSVGDNPQDIVWLGGAVDRLYVANKDAGTVSVVSGFSTLAIDETLTVGTQPSRLLASTLNQVWVANTGSDNLHRFTSSGDLTTAITVGDAPESLAEATDTYIWVANTNATSVSRVQPTSPYTVQTFTIDEKPASTGASRQQALAAADSGKMWVLGASLRKVYLVNTAGSSTAYEVPRGATQLASDGDGNCWVLSTTSRTLTKITTGGTVTQLEQLNGLACVALDLNRKAQVPEDAIDVSRLDSTPVNMALTRPGSVRTALEMLAEIYRFTGIESEGILKYFFVGGAIAATIDEDSLSASQNEQEQTGLAITDQDPVGLPTRVTVKYVGPLRGYDVDETSWERSSGPPDSVPLVIETPLAFTDKEFMTQLAKFLTYEPRVVLRQYAWRGSPAMALLEPGDLASVTSRSLTHTVRVTQDTAGQRGDHEFSAVDYKGYLYDEPLQVTTIDAPDNDPDVPANIPVELLVLETPPLCPADREPRFLMAVTRTQSGEGTYAPTTILESTDGGTSYTIQLFAITEAKVGDVATATPTADHLVLDTSTTIQVVLRDSSKTFTSVSTTLLRNSPFFADNLIQVGSEVIAFATATLVSGATWNLTNLLRGLYGTEQEVGNHVSNETLVHLTPTIRESMAHGYERDFVGGTRHYKAVPDGEDVSTATAVAVTLNGTSIQPWAPPIDSITAQPNGDFIITWRHRSRLVGQWVDGSGGAYDHDDIMTYRIRIYESSSYATVKRTVITSIYTDPEGARTHTYTAAQQITDFSAQQGIIFVGLSQQVTGKEGIETQQSSTPIPTLPFTTSFETPESILNAPTNEGWE